MHHGDGLPVLREETSVRHIHQLQFRRIVIHLHRNRINILGAGNLQVHGKGIAFRH